VAGRNFLAPPYYSQRAVFESLLSALFIYFCSPYNNQFVAVWQVKKAFFALVDNAVRAAPLWDTAVQNVVGQYVRLVHPDKVTATVTFYVYLGRVFIDDTSFDRWQDCTINAP